MIPLLWRFFPIRDEVQLLPAGAGLGIVYHYAVTFVMEKLNKKAIRKAKGGEVRG